MGSLRIRILTVPVDSCAKDLSSRSCILRIRTARKLMNRELSFFRKRLFPGQNFLIPVILRPDLVKLLRITPCPNLFLSFFFFQKCRIPDFLFGRRRNRLFFRRSGRNASCRCFLMDVLSGFLLRNIRHCVLHADIVHFFPGRSVPGRMPVHSGKRFIFRQIGVPHVLRRFPSSFLILKTLSLSALPLKVLIPCAALIIVRTRSFLIGILFQIVVLFELFRMLLAVPLFLFHSLQTVKARIHCLVPGKLQNGSLRKNIDTSHCSHQKDQNGSKGLQKPVQNKGNGSADDSASRSSLQTSRIDSCRIISGHSRKIGSDQFGKNTDDQEKAQNCQNLCRNLGIPLTHQHIIKIQAKPQNRKNIGHHSGQAEHQSGEKAPYDSKIHEIAQEKKNHQRKKRD